MTPGTSNLSRLRKIALREIWADEARDFTPWLASEQNLQLLSETLEMDLRLEGTEHNIGQYRADIVCKDLNKDEWVLIENQLERTNHSHLGQLITYAAGLEAVSIVWIAESFSEQHRAALDWLNEMTINDVNFFGLEIELWRIDNSREAQKFNVVSRPNSWTKGGGGKEPPGRPERLEYWSKFREYLSVNTSDLQPSRATDGASMDVGVGWNGLHIKVGGYDDHDHIFARLSGRREVFDRVAPSLLEHRVSIEKKFGGSLYHKGKLEELNVQANRVGAISRNEGREEDFRWYVATIRKMKAVLGPRISVALTDSS